MKYFISHICVALLLVGTFQLSAQVTCGILDKLDVAVESLFLKSKKSIKYKNSIVAIPIQFHVTRGTDGISDFAPRFVDSILVVLNQGFEDTPFEFYSCSNINYIDDDDFETLYYNSEQAGQNMVGFHSFYNSDEAINVYLANNIDGGIGIFSFSAWASYPWSNNHSYIIAYSSYNSKSHIHEMGHLMGLYHTHRTGELVDGSNCSVKGDLCCDTPAEPNLGSLVDKDCQYSGSGVDFAGQIYTPNIGNHMSYARSKCRTFFTQDQIDRMEYFYYFYFNKYQCEEDFEYSDVSFDEIITSPYPAVEGEPYSLIVKARNLGNVKTETFKVNASLGSNEIARGTIYDMFPTNPQALELADREEFPHDAGRYLICVETKGDSLEINPLNNTFCQEILVRQKAGIPDLVIGELKHPGIYGEQNSLNPISFELENVGSIIAEGISGKIYVDESLVDNFELTDIEVGEKNNIELNVPLGFKSLYDVCIEINPAFTEERLDNNKSCIKYKIQEDLQVDLEVDSIALFPNDSLLIPEKIYKLYYRNISNGPNIAWGVSSYLHINDDVIDSTIYFLNWAWSTTHSKIDSFEFTVPSDISEIDICAELRTYRDTFPDNNILCLSRPVDEVSSLKDITDLSKLTVYPNPVDHVLSIDSENVLRNISIYNNVGSLMFFTNNIGAKSKLINFEKFHPGIYHLVIKTEKNSINRTVIKL